MTTRTITTATAIATAAALTTAQRQRQLLASRIAYWTSKASQFASDEVRVYTRKAVELDAQIAELEIAAAAEPFCADDVLLTPDAIEWLYLQASAACGRDHLEPAHLRSDAGYGQTHASTHAALLWQQLHRAGEAIALPTIQQRHSAAQERLAAAEAAYEASDDATTWGAYLEARGVASVWQDALMYLGF
jgi:hypothetical protein